MKKRHLPQHSRARWNSVSSIAVRGAQLDLANEHKKTNKQKKKKNHTHTHTPTFGSPKQKKSNDKLY